MRTFGTQKKAPDSPRKEPPDQPPPREDPPPDEPPAREPGREPKPMKLEFGISNLSLEFRIRNESSNKR
ncbi:MAG TPA: hypothetical protein VJ805_13760 [Nitrospiraceae bacterium]|nr:hypothetical protein [Nitrospiraceae bacterium]